MMTPVLRGLEADGWEVTVLAKTPTRLLLEHDYPGVRWIALDAPWTAFHGKYHFWRWPWRKLVGALREARRARFHVAVSGRRDPRDHLFLWLAGIPRRIGLRTSYSLWFLNEPLAPPPAQHRVEDWWDVQKRVSESATTCLPPRLGAMEGLCERYSALFAADPRPVLALHCGARNAIRRWPENYLRELITALRAEFDFQLVLYPNSDEYGHGLTTLAEHVLTGLSLPELKASLACARILIANDSGLGHVADALDVPVITIFGPGDPPKIRPFSSKNLVVIRDICPYRPCSDYCHFPEPYCLTQLTPPLVVQEVRAYLHARSWPFVAKHP